MAFTPENSAIRVDKMLEEKLKTASFEEMHEILNQAVVDQGHAVRDYYSPDVLIPVDRPFPKRAKIVVVDGVKHTIEGATETELPQNETAFYRQAFNGAAAPTNREEPQPRDAAGRFTADQGDQEAAIKAADAHLALLRGESDALDRALAARGIDPAALQEVSNQRYQQNWASATAEFLRGPGGSWPGGEANKQKLGDVLVSMGLSENPSVDSLARAYDYMKKNNLVVANEAVEFEDRIAEATSHEELRDILTGGNRFRSDPSLLGR
jgi:hypothetical protein